MINVTWTQVDEESKRIRCEIIADNLGHLGDLLISAGLDNGSEDYFREIRDIKIEVRNDR